MDNQPSREKEREFKELYYRLQEQGKRLSDVYNKLSAVANRIEEESLPPTPRRWETEPFKHRLVQRFLQNCGWVCSIDFAN